MQGGGRRARSAVPLRAKEVADGRGKIGERLDLQGLWQGRSYRAADDHEVVTQSEERKQQRADVWCRRKPCRALALRLGTDRVQFEKRLTDAVLNAVERAGLADRLSGR